jgi:DNA-binding MarR family transcriptional regulator
MAKRTTPAETGRTAASLDDASRAWLSVVRTYNLCCAAISKQIAPLGIGLLEHEILINLMLSPGLTQQDLAARCFTAKSGVSKIVATFEDSGLLTRAADDDDARAKRLTLTASGHALARKAYRAQLNVVGAMAGVYTDEGLRTLDDQMRQTAEVLQTIMRPAPSSTPLKASPAPRRSATAPRGQTKKFKART